MTQATKRILPELRLFSRYLLCGSHPLLSEVRLALHDQAPGQADFPGRAFCCPGARAGRWPGACIRSRPCLTALACMAAGCGSPGNAPTAASSASPAAPPSAAAPPPPAPVNTAATVTGNCAMGYGSPTAGSGGAPQGDYSGFTAGPPKGSTIAGTYWPPAMAYQLTLTDNSGSTADVTGFAVVFYDANGTKAGSDQRNATGFITPRPVTHLDGACQPGRRRYHHRGP